MKKKKGIQGYFSKIKEWMFPNQESDTHRNNTEQLKEKAPYRQPMIKDIQEPRVIHQYPKKGAFRFPIIDDEEKLKEQKPKEQKPKEQKSEQPRPRVGNERKKEASLSSSDQQEYFRTPKEKFQGHNFVVGSSPSPIHGFQKINKKRKDDIEKLAVSEMKAEKSIKPEKETPDIVNNEEEWESQREEIELMSNRVITLDHSKVFSEGIEEVAATSHSLERVDETDEEVIPLFSHETSTDKEEIPIDKVVIKDEKIGSDDSSYPTNEELNEDVDNRVSEPIHRKETDKEKNKPIIRKETAKHKQKSQAKQKGPVVPFNVMMDPHDRVKLKRKQRDHQNDYKFPPLHLLNVPVRKSEEDETWLNEKAKLLNDTFEYFNIRAKVVHFTKGPSVTRFEIQPEPGVKVSKIVNLTDDLKLHLAAKEIRIEAPIPGKNTIGVEVPNDVSEPVFLREVLRHPSFQKASSPLTVAMGMDITGEPVVTDLQKMPHGLIAGATGSGKSVSVNSILTSIAYKASPSEVRLLLIDPKVVELAPYNQLPHLASPVITDPKEATEGLKWAVGEMERRYELFAKAGARDISRYNEKLKRNGQHDKLLPYILIVVDELADLMMVSPQEVEDSICRIAQKARACGIHLLVATQRPSVDVITGLIKSNIPTRVAFSVSSQVDSRTILDGGGAERLLGKGDMLLLENGSSKPVRIQGTFVSDDEIDRVVDYVSAAPKPGFLFEKETLKEQIAIEDEDDLFEEACQFVIEQQAASASLLQRRFRIGYNRAARLIDDMEARGIVSSSRGSKPRDVYLTNHD